MLLCIDSKDYFSYKKRNNYLRYILEKVACKNLWVNKNACVSLPNIITMSRIPMMFLIGFFFYSSFWGAKILAFILYVLAGVTDWLDGYIARKYEQVSDFGKLMDALNDKIFTIGMFLILAGKGLIPLWGIFCVLLIVCREFFITGLRILMAKTGKVLEAEKLGKVKTVLQIVVIGSFFLIEMLKDEVSACPKALIGFLIIVNYINFVVATLLTTYSGYNYLKKYHQCLLI